MQFFKELFSSEPIILSLLIIFIIGLLLKLKPKKAFISSVKIGCGFVGVRLIIELAISSLGTACISMSENLGLSLTIIDIGWPAVSSMTWGAGFAILGLPLSILVNLIMIHFKQTRVLNIDIWNVWHIMFSGTILAIATNNLLIGLLAMVIHSMIVFKLGDWFSHDIDDYFNLQGIAILHGTSIYCAPFAVLIDFLIDRLPFVKDISFSLEEKGNRFDFFSQPLVIGLILGGGVGILAKYNFHDVFRLSIESASVLYLIPKLVKPIMEGLTPYSKVIKDILTKKLNNPKLLIGMDPTLLLGDASVLSSSFIFIPLSIIIALLVPGNKILPFGDLATVGFFIAMGVGIHKGNLFRTLISGSFIMGMTIWIANKTIVYQSVLFDNFRVSTNGIQVVALDQGGSPITYLIASVFDNSLIKNDVLGFSLIFISYILGLIITRYRYINKKTDELI